MSASVSVRFGSIAKAQVGKTVDVPVTVTAGPADLRVGRLRPRPRRASGDRAKVGTEPDGITGFSLSPDESKTFTFKLKGVSVGDAGLKRARHRPQCDRQPSPTRRTRRSRSGIRGSRSRRWTNRQRPTSSGRSWSNIRGLGWDPDGGPIDHSFSGHPLPARPAAATFEGQIHFTLWPQRTTDHHAIEDHGRGGYCWGELATHQGGLYATTDKIRADMGRLGFSGAPPRSSRRTKPGARASSTRSSTRRRHR